MNRYNTGDTPSLITPDHASVQQYTHKPRPCDRDKYRKEYDRIFRKGKKK